jgi:hypothetical protein
MIEFLSQAKERSTTRYDGHQNRRATRPELIAAGAPSPVTSDHCGAVDAWAW